MWYRTLLLVSVLACGAAPHAAPAPPAALQIRFCPASQAWSYPLESRHELESLVLHNILIVNRAAVTVEISAMDIDLLRSGEVVDRRRLSAPDLQRAGKLGAGLQRSGAPAQIPFEFCGDALIDRNVRIAGPTLQHDEALLVFQQAFAFQGARDAVTVRIHGRSAGRDVEITGTLPIRSGMSRTVFRFPLRGSWWVGVGATPHTGHRWVVPEEFALDIARLGDGNQPFRGAGDRFSDYYAYGAEVVAAAAGRVVAAVDGIAEDPSSLRRADETMEAYAARFRSVSDAILRQGEAALAGNYVVIDHDNHEYSLYAHLRPGSVQVKVGQTVTAGQPLARLGSSGNSTDPHLHFQVCDAPGPLRCAGIPIHFEGITLPWADFPRPVQSGDWVIAP